MRDSREKGAGIRDQDPPSRPCVMSQAVADVFPTLLDLIHSSTDEAFCITLISHKYYQTRGMN